MQLISSRTIETTTLSAGEAREALFRDDNGTFILYRADGKPAVTGEDRVLRLDLREALIWLNETSQQQGSFWT